MTHTGYGIAVALDKAFAEGRELQRTIQRLEQLRRQ